MLLSSCKGCNGIVKKRWLPALIMAEEFVNISSYRFVEIPDRDELRQPFRDITAQLDMKGTILLAPEGINMFLSATRENMDKYVEWLYQDERFDGMWMKESFSDHQPFNRMLVRLKKEIISVGMPEIVPEQYVAPEIEPLELKAKLDAGEDIVFIETRNDYEIRVGTFEGAVDPEIETFRQFPAAIEKLPSELKEKEVVIFCTGGIRCEKAGTIMENAGFKNVKSIKGGILAYFEQVGGDYWDGDCFVFDRRVAVNPQLEETDHAVCYACREPLSVEEQASEHYVPAVSCPYCFDRN